MPEGHLDRRDEPVLRGVHAHGGHGVAVRVGDLDEPDLSGHAGDCAAQRNDGGIEFGIVVDGRSTEVCGPVTDGVLGLVGRPGTVVD